MATRKRHSGDPVCIHDISVFLDCQSCETECQPAASDSNHSSCSSFAAIMCPYCEGLIPILQAAVDTKAVETAPSSD